MAPSVEPSSSFSCSSLVLASSLTAICFSFLVLVAWIHLQGPASTASVVALRSVLSCSSPGTRILCSRLLLSRRRSGSTSESARHPYGLSFGTPPVRQFPLAVSDPSSCTSSWAARILRSIRPDDFRDKADGGGNAGSGTAPTLLCSYVVDSSGAAVDSTDSTVVGLQTLVDVSRTTHDDVTAGHNTVTLDERFRPFPLM
jgi:hypothetical protein